MPYRPRKPTTAARVTLSQEIRVFLEPEVDAPPGSWRKVQVLIPQSPECFIGIDKKPEDLGTNRTYKLPFFPPGAQISFMLQPQQFLVGASGTNLAFVTVLVEYLGGE